MYLMKFVRNYIKKVLISLLKDDLVVKTLQDNGVVQEIQSVVVNNYSTNWRSKLKKYIIHNSEFSVTIDYLSAIDTSESVNLRTLREIMQYKLDTNDIQSVKAINLYLRFNYNKQQRLVLVTLMDSLKDNITYSSADVLFRELQSELKKYPEIFI